MSADKIGPQHRGRKAVLYVRQSSAHQVQHNRESQVLQYAMRDRRPQLGWSQIAVIDDALGDVKQLLREDAVAGHGAYPMAVAERIGVISTVLKSHPAEKRFHLAGLFQRLSPRYLEPVDHFAGLGESQFVETLAVEVIEHLLRLLKGHAGVLCYLGNGQHTMVLAGQVKNSPLPGFERSVGCARLGVMEEPDTQHNRQNAREEQERGQHGPR